MFFIISLVIWLFSFTEQNYGGSCESDNECVGDLMCRDGDSGLQCLCATGQYNTGNKCTNSEFQRYQ